ncbi:hypothetical protein CH63R_12804 [Colletotrichum higginsianum IMI 349063]|uniref:Uncharacterized protein n=1 Tax=Colletotrichum higginsianum (strain IMI 349063) TaxID=759273 RepID=A0A1B7XV72_COLHI|nr:hypothetical protein CH63R_12804 [Colletotrichum higginsianum IMI 349063]OBR03677.1 hypothetical protein CH63R_12804 [Colletotrichum higginsianum IMI 349063]
MSGGRQAAQRKQPAASEGKKAARRPSAGLAALLSDEEELNRQPRHWIQCVLLDDSNALRRDRDDGPEDWVARFAGEDKSVDGLVWGKWDDLPPEWSD